MAYCGPRGIPLDTFLEWPQASQDAALQWQAHEDARCRGCGTHSDDWIGDDGRRVDAPIHWHPHLCFGCAEREKAMEGTRREPEPGVTVMAAAGPSHECPTCSL